MEIYLNLRLVKHQDKQNPLKCEHFLKFLHFKKSLHLETQRMIDTRLIQIYIDFYFIDNTSTLYSYGFWHTSRMQLSMQCKMSIYLVEKL